ncbi:PDZ domain-containing protein [Novipirellula sp. SH528]|uniref:PDZ domain-containing protein n=1 Tax=Novipirellula sp. SH528 TaxID=3454466 RepID=UPI003F9F72DF
MKLPTHYFQSTSRLAAIAFTTVVISAVIIGLPAAVAQQATKPEAAEQQITKTEPNKSDETKPATTAHRGELRTHATDQPGQSQPRRLGVGLSESASGILVENVVPNSPAERAGLKSGDVILKIDNRPVPNINQLLQKLKTNTSDRFEITLRRGETEQTVVAEFLADAVANKNVGSMGTQASIPAANQSKPAANQSNESLRADVQRLREEVEALRRQVNKLIRKQSQNDTKKSEIGENDNREQNKATRKDAK